MKVLIVKTSALGDIVHALPVVNYLHSVDENLQIDWLVEKPFAALLEGQRHIRRVHRIDTKIWRKPHRIPDSWTGIRNVLWSLRREHYDVVLDLQGNSKSGLFTFLTGAPQRFGFDRNAVREWPNLLATNRRIALDKEHGHITDRALKIAASAFPGGSGQAGAGILTIDGGTLSAVRKRLHDGVSTGRKSIVLHPGTTWKTKCLSPEFWRKLTAELGKDRSLQLIFTWGTESELSDIRRLKEQTNSTGWIWPRGGLKELMALLAQADLVMGGDTGPVHIAAAFGTPTVSFYRATDRRRNGPRGENHVTFQSAMECSPCLSKDCPRDNQCSNSLMVEEAAAAVQALLGRTGG